VHYLCEERVGSFYDIGCEYAKQSIFKGLGRSSLTVT